MKTSACKYIFVHTNICTCACLMLTYIQTKVAGDKVFYASSYQTEIS